MPLTEDAQIDEYRQAAEMKLADRKLGIVLNNYARDFPGLFNSNTRSFGRDCHDEWDNERARAIEPFRRWPN